MKVKLPYGKESLILELPDDRAQIIEPKRLEETSSNAEILENALEKPLAGSKLEDLVRNKRVCALVEDSTRNQPHWHQIEASAKRLKKTRHIQYIITTGSHDSEVEGNLEIARIIEEIAKRYHLNHTILIHDCERPVTEVGITSRGTRVEVDPELLKVEVFFVTSNMKNHYFAGYCNAIKNFLPGCCSFKTIEANHRLALETEASFGRHPWHNDPKRRSNPVAEDMLEAMNLISQGKRVYTLATIGSKRLIWAAAGDVETVTREGIKVVDQTTSFYLKPCKYSIVSPGGYPDDETLYTSQRGLDLVNNAILDKGEVLWLAACGGGHRGLAPSEKAKRFFYDSLTLDKSKTKLAPEIKKNYRLFKQKAYKMARIIGRVNRVWLYSRLDERTVQAAHLNPTKNPQKIIDQWIRHDPREQILVFKHANKLAIYSTALTKGPRKKPEFQHPRGVAVAAGDRGNRNLLQGSKA
ncbi:MAG: lactate racemase domain-containing protein [bacterium]